MAHFSATTPIRIHRTFKYGSFAVLAVASELHSCKAPLVATSRSGNIINDK